MKTLLLIVISLLLVGCSNVYDGFVVISKQKNPKIGFWNGYADSFMVVKNVITHERELWESNLGAVGDTIYRKQEWVGN